MRAIDIRPGGLASVRRTVALDGVAVVLSTRWLPGVGRWTMAVETPSGEPVTRELVVAPGGVVGWDRRRDDVPGGLLAWSGPDPYGRDDLGGDLQLIYIEAADIPGEARLSYRQILAGLPPPRVDFSSTVITFDSTSITFDNQSGEQ